MRRGLPLFLAAVAVALGAAAGAGAGSDREITLTPVSRVSFPDRAYVVDLPAEADLASRGVTVTENGVPVSNPTIKSLSGSGLNYGVVLALDASESMTGAPFRSALVAARRFVDRREPTANIGLVAFNGGVQALEAPTDDEQRLARALESPPPLAHGTRIYDGIDRSISLLRAARLSTGSVVVLSDGADLGSVRSLEAVVAAAKRTHVRIFTVGLRSRAYDGTTLRSLAERTGGTHAEASSPGQLAAIYDALGVRLAREYVLQYRSNVRPKSAVDVAISITGIGEATAGYVAPTPAGLEPFHRSALSRFLLSPASTIVLSLLGALFVAWVMVKFLRRPKSAVVERIAQFADRAVTLPRTEILRKRRIHYDDGRWQRLADEMEIARMEMTPRALVGWTLAAMTTLVLILVLVAPVFALAALAAPLGARAIVRRNVRKVREAFADELPANLQILASALRAGHSFSGALNVVVENAHEPAKSELRRIVRDDQFGIPPEDAIRSVAVRMANRDLEQVALLAELQRTAGGNSAEVLDTVVDTIRDRADIRRLVKTLTAQGRMARWILTALPIGIAGFMWLINPGIMSAMFTSGGGQIALLIAGLMVAAGSAIIQRIVDIQV